MLVQFTVPGLAALPTLDWRQEEAWPCIILACTSAEIQLVQLLVPLCLHLIEPNATVNSAHPGGRVVAHTVQWEGATRKPTSLCGVRGETGLVQSFDT